MKLKAIILDDEPGALEILVNYISRMPELSLEGKFLMAEDAIKCLKQNPVDLVLLDITMPEVTGFQFLENLAYQPIVIFTTAHSEFAVKSYEYDALDYLKKPFSFDRFKKAIQKAIDISLLRKGKTVKTSIDLKIDGVMQTIPLNIILYFQSYGNYIKIITERESLITHMTTKELESLLPMESFVRIQKSFIVNRSKIINVTEREVRLSTISLPIGKTFRRFVKYAFGKIALQ